MCFNQRLSGSSLKLVEKFTNLGSSVSSTETDFNMRLARAWTANDRLSVIWKSDLTDKIKCVFFQTAVMSILLHGCTTWTLTKRMEKKLDGNYTRILLVKTYRERRTIETGGERGSGRSVLVAWHDDEDDDDTPALTVIVGRNGIGETSPNPVGGCWVPQIEMIYHQYSRSKAWTAVDRLSIIWKSDLTDKMKRSFFQAAVVSILLYGCTTWTLTKRLEKKLDGNYTRMLRAILNRSWQLHPTRRQLYGHLPPITKTI